MNDGSVVRPGDGYADDARRYRLDERIATGGMGEVWRATDEVLDRRVAVKLLKTELADDGGFRTRFETEARNAARLQHPGVAGIFDYGQAAPRDGSPTPRPYLVMELVDGQPLSALLRPGNGMDPAVATALIAQAADAIGAAHAAGIVHRDVKPANLLVTPDRSIKITDFGIARAAEGVALTQTGQVMGTPQYLAPEQAEGKQAVPASDVYSLACVAYECLVGARPFTGESSVAVALAHLREPVPELPDHLPSGLVAVVRRGLAKRPEDRYADGAEFAAALRDPSAADIPAVPPPPPAEQTSVLPAAAAGAGLGAAAASRPAPTPSSYRTTRTEQRPPEPKRRRGTPGWVPWAVLAAAALLGILIVALVFGGQDDGTDPVDDEPTPTSEQTEDDGQQDDPDPPPDDPEPQPDPTTPDEPEPEPTAPEEPEPEPTTPDEPEPTTPDEPSLTTGSTEQGLELDSLDSSPEGGEQP